MSAKLMPLGEARDGADSSFDEIVEHIGELVDVGGIAEAHQLIAQHPEHAERLHKLLPAIEILASIDVTRGDFLAGADDQSRQLGDFRLLREIGRGGMGVVYEADQLSLGRRVALKVLTNAALLDSRQLERFKNEARIAAGLHHGNIVPVYTVGSERGVHFYAMQLIDGRDLADVIEQARLAETPHHEKSPRPSLAAAASTIRDEQALLETPGELASNSRLRTMVGWAATVADALAYAHGLGVLHRDIKPANLLVDRTGKIWVSDFGLARLESVAALTAGGDVLGTLRYMSPELARGDHAAVNAGADIHALGVTLYEMLTLQPAFAGTNREELLRSVTERDPVPPRRINSAISQDLETIVLKAIAKEPSGRYASAQEFADDLRRFLDHKPIVARRPNFVDRACKWARRHAALVVVVVAALATVAAIGVAASFFTLQAYHAEARQREQAEGNLLLAAESIDRMLSRVASDAQAAGDMKRAETLATDATEFYEKLLQRSQQPRLAYQAALAYEQVAVIWTLIEQYEKSARAYRRAKALLAAVAVPSGRAEHQFAMAEAYMGEAETALSLRRFVDAEAQYASALAICEQLSEQYPRDPDYDQAVAAAVANLGLAQWLAGRLDDAEVSFARATSIETALPEVLQSLPEMWESRGMTLNNWGMLVLERGQHRRALQMFEESIKLQKRAFAIWGSEPADHGCFRAAHRNIVAAHADAEEWPAVMQAIDRLVAACPGHLDASLEGALLLLESAKVAPTAEASAFRERAELLLGEGLKAPRQTQQAREQAAWFFANYDDPRLRDPATARRLAQSVLAESPERSGAWYALAWAAYRSGDWSAAEKALESAARFSAEGRATADDWLLLAMIRHQQGEHEEARKCLAKGQAIPPDGSESEPSLSDLLDEARRLIEPSTSKSPEGGA